MKENRKWKKCLIWLLWGIIWWLASMAVGNEILFAGPVATVRAFCGLLLKGNFYLIVLGSLLRICAGFLLGFAVAVILAAFSKCLAVFEEMLTPFMNLIKTVPIASFVVLLLIWWGSEFLAVAVSFLVVFPQIYISTLEGLKSADVSLLEMAKVHGVSLWDKFFYIFRPALKPFWNSGLKIALGMCWKSGVAAEVIGTPDYSIGERLYLSKVYIDTAELFAWTVVIALLSTLFEKVVLWVAECFFAWEPQCRGVKCAEGNSGIGDGDVQSGEIRLEAVTKSYGEQGVLENVSAVYESGGIYYLTSPSGSGKTTLLRILAGLTLADDGGITKPHHCSMVFQEDRLCEDYNAVKNVELVLGDLRGKYKNGSVECGNETVGAEGILRRETAERALRKLLPAEALYKPCRELSGGMKRRVALVRAMEAESDFVLLDEPFTGMDADTKCRAEEYIRERQRGRILIIATHI